MIPVIFPIEQENGWKNELKKDIFGATMEILASAIYGFVNIAVAEETANWLNRGSISLIQFAAINGSVSGLSIALLILLFFHTSGGHISCIVTIPLAVSGIL